MTDVPDDSKWHVPAADWYGDMFDVTEEMNKNRIPEGTFTPKYRPSSLGKTYMGASIPRSSIYERHTGPNGPNGSYVTPAPRVRPWWIRMWDWAAVFGGRDDVRTEPENDTVTSNSGAGRKDEKDDAAIQGLASSSTDAADGSATSREQ